MPDVGKSQKLANTIIESLKGWEAQLTANGGKILDSSVPFQLRDGHIHTVDAGWVNERDWHAYKDASHESTPYLSPDFVVKFFEYTTDSLDSLKAEMLQFIEEGCQLGWLIEPNQEQVFIYQPHEPVHQIPTFDYYLDGRNILKGFEFPLRGLRF